MQDRSLRIEPGLATPIPSTGNRGSRSQPVTKHYTVSDGELVLFLWPAAEGGYTVTSPLEPGLVTQAGSVEEAFEMARDACEVLRLARSGGKASGETSPRAVPRTAVRKRRKPSVRGTSG